MVVVLIGCSAQRSPETVYSLNKETLDQLHQVLRDNYPVLISLDTCTRWSADILTITIHDYMRCFPNLDPVLQSLLQKVFDSGIGQQITITPSSVFVQVDVESNQIRTSFHYIVFGEPTFPEQAKIHTRVIEPGVFGVVDIQDSY